MTEKRIFPENTDPAELADLIDSLMSEGSGHITVVSDNGGNEVSVKTVRSTDCTGKNGACCQPTELMDDEE